MKRILLLTAALAFVAVPAAAHAQPTTPQADEQNAQAFSDQAYDAYEKGNYPKALQLYLESYKLNPTADVLYNIASIYDKKLNDPRLALEYYRRHNSAPDAKGDLVGKATARIASLQAQLDNPNGTRADSGGAGGRGEGGDPGSTYRTAGIITGAVGIAGIGLGVVTGIIASGKHSDAKNAGCSGNTCPTDDATSKEKDAHSVATISTIGFIAGGVLLAGGAALYLLAPKRTSGTTRGSIQVTPQGDFHGGGLAVLGRF